MTAFYQVMRLYGAGLRLTMIRVAAKKWGVKEEECRAEKHRVYGPSGRSIDYRWLLAGAKKEKPPTYEDINKALKKPEDFRYIGKGKEKMPFYDATDMVRGKTVYGADVDLPGMLTAMIERCPVANGALLTYDPNPALAVPGVRAVLPMFPPGVRGGGVGRASCRTPASPWWRRIPGRRLQGRRALEDDHPMEQGPPRQLRLDGVSQGARSGDREPPRKSVRNKGNVDDARWPRARLWKPRYYVPHLAQTPMEPPVAIALFKNGRMEVWAPTQNPDDAQQMAGQVALGLPRCRTATKKSGKGAAGRDGAHDDAGRRLRAQVETRLRRRGGHARQADARRADPRAVDARGRHQVQLLQRGQQPAPEGGARRRRTSDRASAAQRPHLVLRDALPEPDAGLSAAEIEGVCECALASTAANTHTARASSARRVSRTCRSTSRTSASRTARPRTTSASAGCAPWPTSTTPSASARSPTRWRTPPDAIPRTICSS